MEEKPSTPQKLLQKVSQLIPVGASALYNILKVYQSWTPGKLFFSRWRPRWPPKPLNDHNYVTVNPNLMILMSMPRFWGARNTLKPLKMKMVFSICIPTSLRTALETLFLGKETRHKVAAVGQAIIQAVHPRAVIAPLQIGLAVQIHHLYSKIIVDHKMVSCSSYTEVIKFEKMQQIVWSLMS